MRVGSKGKEGFEVGDRCRCGSYTILWVSLPSFLDEPVDASPALLVCESGAQFGDLGFEGAQDATWVFYLHFHLACASALHPFIA